MNVERAEILLGPSSVKNKMRLQKLLEMRSAKPICGRKGLRINLIGLAVVAAFADAGLGASRSWSGGGGNNSWTTQANWTGNTPPTSDLTSDIAVFNLTSYPRQPTANSVSVSGIQIGDGATTTAALTIGGSGTGLAIGGSGITIYANAGTATLGASTTIGAAQSWANNSANAFNISTGGVTYNNLLTLNGGMFSFNAAGTGSSGIKISNGSTAINGSTGAIFGTGTIEFNSGTYESSNSSLRSLSNTVSITGDFSFDSLSTGIIEFSGGGSTTGDRQLNVNTVTTRFVTNPLSLGGNLTTAGNGRLNITGGLNLGSADRMITAGATGTNGNLLTGAVDASASGKTLTIAGSNFSLTGVTPGSTNAVNFDVNATGTITFSGTNTFLGRVIVEAGTANATSDTPFGSSTSSNGGLYLSPSSGTATVTFTSAAPAIAALASSGLGTSSVILGNSSSSPAASTTLTIGGGGQSTTFSGSISDKSSTASAATGSVIKSGAGTLTFAGTNSYTGGTTVSAGTLLANSSNSTGTGAVTVSGGGKLGGNNGTILNSSGKAVSINGGGFISPGDAAPDSNVGTLTTNEEVWKTGTDAASQGSYNWTLNNIASDSGNDLINVQSGGLTVNTSGGGIFIIAIQRIGSATNSAASGSFTILRSPNAVIDPSVVNALTIVDTTGSVSQSWAASLKADGASGSDIVITPTPEPSTALAFGSGLTALSLVRRRRRSLPG